MRQIQSQRGENQAIDLEPVGKEYCLTYKSKLSYTHTSKRNFLSIWAGITTPESLSQKRPYIIVGVFVFGMLLTPPDVFSQTLLDRANVVVI